MSGRLQDAWRFAWAEIWEPLEESEGWVELADHSGYTTDELYVDLYLALVKATRKAPQPPVFDATANDPLLAREALKTTSPENMRSDTATARFFESAAEVIAESGSVSLLADYRDLVDKFLTTRNLRYELLDPFELRSHLPGVFEALMTDVTEATTRHPQVRQALTDFSHAFRSLQRTHVEADMKTCIHKAAMLAEALASLHPEARGNNFGALCDSLTFWPNSLVRESIKKLYEFSSDFPGVRHNIVKRKAPRELELRDSMIVPLLLLTASGYFGGNVQLLDTLGSQLADPPQEPPDPPEISQRAREVSMP
jgi:hypothetical protein